MYLVEPHDRFHGGVRNRDSEYTSVDRIGQESTNYPDLISLHSVVRLR